MDFSKENRKQFSFLKLKEKRITVGSDLTSTKAKRLDIEEYPQSHYKLPKNTPRKKIMLYLKFYIKRKQLGVFLNILRENLYDKRILTLGFKMLHEYVVKGEHEKRKTVQYGIFMTLKMVLKIHCVKDIAQSCDLRYIVCAIITSLGKSYAKDMIATGVFDGIVNVFKCFVEYYQANAKLCKNKQTEHFYNNILRSISSILSIGSVSSNYAYRKPLDEMLSFIGEPEERSEGPCESSEELLVVQLKQGCELFKQHLCCVESTYICLKHLKMYL